MGAGPVFGPGVPDAVGAYEFAAPGRITCVAGSAVSTRVASSILAPVEGTGIVPAIMDAKSPMLWGRRFSYTFSAASIAPANVADTWPLVAVRSGTIGSFR